jgi:hypothetical protein
MAKKQNNPNDVAEGFATDIRFKTYKSEGFYTFAEGDELVGTLLSIRDQTIMDRRKKMEKVIRVYNIRTADGKTIKLGSRAMLDRMIDDIMDENGGFEVQNHRYSGKGYEYLQQRLIKINRGEDEETTSGDGMGSYEIGIEE